MNFWHRVRFNLLLPSSLAVCLLIAGIFDLLNSAWGYGLFVAATLLLGVGAATFMVYICSKTLSSTVLKITWSRLLWLGFWSYICAVAALSGYFINETIEGRMEIEWVLFGPVALVAIIAIEFGLYKILIVNNLPTWKRYGYLVTRDAIDTDAMRRTLYDDVVLHRTLFSISTFRWLRHTLIYWGFITMFGLEILAVMVREAWPAFGGEDIWEITAHPLRLAFDFGYDFTGTMVLLGCILALIWRVMVNNKPEKKFADTPSTIFLLFVVASGFVLEALRLAALPPDPIYWFSFLGYSMSFIFVEDELSGLSYMALWYIHVFGSCAFIAYIPVKRLVHSCATPMGRLMNSQKKLLTAKRESHISGLMGR
ncbi:MAG: hypothetical protein CMF69_05425 [Magnetovibrio sp.]|nr:hypothetical protein [Magnetovibrio sp.]